MIGWVQPCECVAVNGWTLTCRWCELEPEEPAAIRFGNGWAFLYETG